MRKALIIAACTAAIASGGCASSGAYAPSPFPTANRPASSPAVPAPAAAPDRPRANGPSAAPAPEPRTAMAAGVITTALDLRGIPYRLGGADITGFDCSGLVQYVMRQHGVTMPRTVIEQFGMGDRAKAIDAGDLVFFQTIGSKASHVGIAIDAESFVHAPNSRGVVRVERLDSPYWSSRFLGARRVF